MDFKQFTKNEIDQNFKRSYVKLMAGLDYFEGVFQNDKYDLRKVKEMKRELKSLKYFRNQMH